MKARSNRISIALFCVFSVLWSALPACDQIIDAFSDFYNCIIAPKGPCQCSGYLCDDGYTPEQWAGDHENGGDPIIDTGATVTQGCDGPYLKVWTAGGASKPVYYWASLEYQGEQVAESYPLRIDSGTFWGYYVKIPLGGLQLEDDDYSFSTYYCDSLSQVGDRKRSIFRHSEQTRFRFPEAVRTMVGRAPIHIKHATSETETACMYVSQWNELTTNLLPDGIEIIDGTQKSEGSIWQLMGSRASACELIVEDHRYILHAVDTVSDPGSCMLVVTDPTWGNYSDTLRIEVMACQQEDCCNRNRKYAGVKGNDVDLIGAKADIYVRYGARLCGPAADTVNATFSLVWVAVSTDMIDGDFRWGQAGFGVIRRVGKQAQKYRYLEVVGGEGEGLQQLLDPLFPAEHTTHEFSVELNPASGVWTAYCDDIAYLSSEVFGFWASNLGSFAKFSAEIYHRENDMAGTVSEPCRMKDLMTKTINNSDYGPFSFNRIYHQQDDPPGWMLKVDEDSGIVDIWDGDPR